MGTFGGTGTPTLNSPMATNTKTSARYTTTDAINNVTSMFLYLDGQGPGTGSQVFKGVVYSNSSSAPSALLATTDEVTVTDGQSAGWVEATFPAAFNLSASTTYWLGMILGDNTETIRTYMQATGASGDERYNADTYSDGPSNPFGGSSSFTSQLSIYLYYPDPSPAGSIDVKIHNA